MPTTQSGLGIPGFLACVGIAKEATFATATPPTSGSYLPVLDVTGFEGANKLINAAGIRQSVGNPPPGAGSFDVAPSFSLEVDPDNIGLLLGLSMGKDTVTGSSAPYSHAFTLNNAMPRLSTATISVDPFFNSGSTPTVYQAVGCKLSQLDFTAKQGAYFQAKAMFSGKDVVPISGTLSSPVYSAARPFEWAHLAGTTQCQINGVNANLNDFNISLKNTLKPHFGSQGGRKATSIDETLFLASGSFSLNLVDNTIDNILWGGSTPTAGYIPTVALVVTLTHIQIAGGSTPYSISFNMPAITLSDAAKTVKRGDVVTLTSKFVASESAAGNHNDISITVVNAAAAAYV